MRSFSRFGCILSFIAIFAFAFMAFLSWSEKKQVEARMTESHTILQTVQNKFDKQKVSLDYNLEPSFRQNALDKFKKSPRSRKRLMDVLKTELAYQKYLYELLPELERRLRNFAGLTLGFVLLTGVFYLLFLHHCFHKPLQHLRAKMQHFLNNKYAYELDVPSNDEVGQLYTVFNGMAKQVHDQIEGLTDLDKAKSEFLSIASHELRTPLTSIKGSLSLMEHGVLETISDDTKGLLSIAGNETDRLIRLINELLDLAKIEAGQFPLNKDWVGANGLIEDVKNKLTGLASKAGVRIETECDDYLEVDIDRDRLQQVIINLVSNAIKFSPEDSVVTVSMVTKNDQCFVQVIDKGPGIAPEDQELIFEKFRQATSKDNPLVKGTGLGLAIAKALIEQHGGQIHLKSYPGKGSTFYFTLPEWRHNKKLEQAA